MSSLMTPIQARGGETAGSLLFRRDESAAAQDQAQRRSPASPSYALTGYNKATLSESRRRGTGRMTPGSAQGSPVPPVRTLADDLETLGLGPPGLSSGTPAAGWPPSESWAREASPPRDAWVTVFGFRDCDLGLVLDEFRLCGEILSYGFFGQDGGNFVHIQYADGLSAQRALSMSGVHLKDTLIVGVRPLGEADRRHVEAYTSTHPVPHSPLDRGVHVKPEVARPQAPRQTNAAPLAVPGKTWWGKVAEFVLGF